MKEKNVIKLFFLLLLCIPIVAAYPIKTFAGEPTDQIKHTVDAVLDVLRDKELKKPEMEKQRRPKIRKIVSERFDFKEMAKRSLALHWKKRTPEEQNEFVTLYTDLLENTYIKKIEKYEDEKIVYVGEKTEGTFAVVKTNVITKKEVEVPIEYRLLRGDGKWFVYDVVIEGVSLVNNYRNQFNSIIHSDSYEELVRRLKNKALKEPV